MFKSIVLIIFLIFSTNVFSKSEVPDVEKFFNAVTRNNVEETKEMLNQGIDVNIRNEQGYTALMEAGIYEAYDTFKLLLERGADLWLRTPTRMFGDRELKGQNVLEIAKRNELDKIIEIIQDYIVKEFYEARKPHFIQSKVLNDIEETPNQKEIDTKYIELVKKELSL